MKEFTVIVSIENKSFINDPEAETIYRDLILKNKYNKIKSLNNIFITHKKTFTVFSKFTLNRMVYLNFHDISCTVQHELLTKNRILTYFLITFDLVRW